MADSNLKVTRLGGGGADFQQMIQRFGVVTVMNARVYEPLPLEATTTVADAYNALLAPEIIAKFCSLSNGQLVFKDYTDGLLARLDTLKIANANQEGPTKTITGGQYANPLIKFGKTMTLEMQDALGDARALDALNGTVSEASQTPGNPTATPPTEGSVDYTKIYALHVTTDFQGPKLIIGDTFFIDQKTGQQVKALIAFYQFVPDSIFNLTQDAEGDATVFNMNGSLLATDILVHDINGQEVTHGVFYSIVDPEDVKTVLGA